MNNATFRIAIQGSRVVRKVRGDSEQNALSRACHRFPAVKNAANVTVTLVRTHVVAIDIEGRAYHGPWAEDEEQAHVAFFNAMQAQWPDVPREQLVSAIQQYEYVLEQ